jgi:hypothetical protein
MPKVANLMAFGMASQLANEIVNGLDEVGLAISAAGTIITDATDLTKHVNVITTCASNAGVQLPDSYGWYYVENAGSNAGKIWPHSASGTLNSGSAGASITFTNAKAYLAIRVSSTDWRVIQLN